MTPPTRHVGVSIGRRAAAVLAALAVVGVATGSAEASSAARNDAQAKAAAAEAPRAGRSGPEIFTGDLEDFYVVPTRCLQAGRAS